MFSLIRTGVKHFKCKVNRSVCQHKALSTCNCKVWWAFTFCGWQHLFNLNYNYADESCFCLPLQILGTADGAPLRLSFYLRMDISCWNHVLNLGKRLQRSCITTTPPEDTGSIRQILKTESSLSTDLRSIGPSCYFQLKALESGVIFSFSPLFPLLPLKKHQSIFLLNAVFKA